MPPDVATPDVALIAARAELDRLWGRGSAFLGCDVAIMGGAMSWVSERHLVAADYTELAVRALHTAYGLDAA